MLGIKWETQNYKGGKTQTRGALNPATGNLKNIKKDSKREKSDQKIKFFVLLIRFLDVNETMPLDIFISATEYISPIVRVKQLQSFLHKVKFQELVG